MLWASTGTKNAAYSDVLYVESLIGPDTINTLPDATLAAFRDSNQLNVLPDIHWCVGGTHRQACLAKNVEVVYLENKFLYRHYREEMPEEDYVVPIGVAALRTMGSDLSIISYGAAVHLCVEVLLSFHLG